MEGQGRAGGSSTAFEKVVELAPPRQGKLARAICNALKNNVFLGGTNFRGRPPSKPALIDPLPRFARFLKQITYSVIPPLDITRRRH